MLGVCDGRVVEVEEADSGRAGAVEACALGPCPVREGDWGPGTFCRVVDAWVGAAGGGIGSTLGGAPQFIWCLCGPCSCQCGAGCCWRW